MKTLKQYIIALTNLYGIVPQEKVVEIYNKQNNDKITIESISKYISLKKSELEEEFVCIDDDFFVQESFYVFGGDLIENTLRMKADKPYYIPKKKELLKYTDDFYFEKNKQYNSLYNYIKKNLVDNEELVEEICEDIQGMLHVNSNIGTVMNVFNYKDIVFENDKQVQDILNLIIDFSNNMRLWENNGYTPREIANKFENSNLGNLPKKKKIGRNEPCPCGSGKKYKKCCINKK